MSQILDPLPNDENNHILCCYVNATSQIQVARITNIANWYFERVVFPGQRLVFESEPQGILEIHSGMMASAILSDTIPCTKLALQAINTRNAGQESKNESSVDLNQDDSSNQENIAPSFNVAV
ncbi:MAG: DUF1830 domain-containing protein [Pleurocapsa sp.]